MWTHIISVTSLVEYLILRKGNPLNWRKNHITARHEYCAKQIVCFQSKRSFDLLKHNKKCKKLFVCTEYSESIY